jgi:hypothetical protein
MQMQMQMRMWARHPAVASCKLRKVDLSLPPTRHDWRTHAGVIRNANADGHEKIIMRRGANVHQRVIS